MKTLQPYRPLLPPSWLTPGFENRLRRFFGPELWPEIMEEPFAWTPRIDLVDRDGELLLTAELPGMTLKDIEIDVVDDVLTLKGEKKNFEEREKGSLQIAERTYGMFERAFTLPRYVKADKIAAEFKNGVLTVHMPKAKEAQGRKIEIAEK